MIHAAVLVVNSKIVEGESLDSSRSALEGLLESYETKIDTYEVIRDDRTEIQEKLVSLCDSLAPHVIFTLGGTGLRPTDWVPEATRDVIEKEIPGIGEAMRSESIKKVKTAMLSRGTAGIRGTTLIVNLPGSPKGIKDNLMIFMPILELMIEKTSKLSHIHH